MPSRAQRVLVVSTPSIEGCPVQRYAGFVSARAVMGAGILKDMGAWFTDFAGGRSGGYEQELERATDHVLRELKRKAALKNANCILSVSVQIESIGGKNLSMLSVAAEGTAVWVDFEQSEFAEVAALATEMPVVQPKERGAWDASRLFAFTQGMRQGRLVHDSTGLSIALTEFADASDEFELKDVLRLWLGSARPVPIGNDDGLGLVEYLRSFSADHLARHLVPIMGPGLEDAGNRELLLKALRREAAEIGALLQLVRATSNPIMQGIGLRLICEFPMANLSYGEVDQLVQAVNVMAEVESGSRYSSRNRALEVLAGLRQSLEAGQRG